MTLEKQQEQELLEKAGAFEAPETVMTPEQEKGDGQEQAAEQQSEALPDAASVEQDVPQPSTTASDASGAGALDASLSADEEQELKEVEQVLEEDLGDVYIKMDPATQETFKQQGEVAAKEIFGLLHHMKLKTKKVLSIITKWLKIIPGLNKFFLEQEAKIKTDKIVDIHEEHHPDQQ